MHQLPQQLQTVKDFGDKLKAMRKARGWSQPQAAEHLGVTAATVSILELGKTEPSLKTFLTVLQVFGVSVDYMLDAPEEGPTRAGRHPSLRRPPGQPGVVDGSGHDEGAVQDRRSVTAGVGRAGRVTHETGGNGCRGVNTGDGPGGLIGRRADCVALPGLVGCLDVARPPRRFSSL